MDEISKKGLAVNLRFGPGKGGVPLPQSAQMGYLSSEENVQMSSINLLNFISPDMSTLSSLVNPGDDRFGGEISPVSDRHEYDDDEDDGDLVAEVLGLESDDEEESMGEDEDFGDEGFGILPLIPVAITSFVASAAGQALINKMKSGAKLSKDEHRRIFEIIPALPNDDLVHITRNPFRSKRVKDAALAELTARRSGRRPAPARALPKKPQARPQPARAVAPVQRQRPLSAPQPTRAQPGRYRQPAATSSVHKSRPAYGAEGESYSLTEAWAAHPWQTLAATLGVLAVGVAIDRSGLVDKAASVVTGGSFNDYAY
jgi:hypothetical protein